MLVGWVGIDKGQSLKGKLKGLTRDKEECFLKDSLVLIDLRGNSMLMRMLVGLKFHLEKLYKNLLRKLMKNLYVNLAVEDNMVM